MKVIYDSDADILDLLFREVPVAESDEVREGVVIDYGADGKIVAVEVLDASRHVTETLGIAYELRGSEKKRKHTPKRVAK
jgi:uncharacterized protein YuzE